MRNSIPKLINKIKNQDFNLDFKIANGTAVTVGYDITKSALN